MAPMLSVSVTRRGIIRLCVGLSILLLCLSSASMAVTYSPPEVQPTTIEREPAGSTVMSIQGYNIGGNTNPNKPARVLSAAPNGSLQWLTNGNQLGVSWFYDVDPLPNGDLLVVGTLKRGQTRVLRVNPKTKTINWSEKFQLHDTHDVTLTENGNLLVANMRNTVDGVSNDRLFVYNRTADEISWEWKFREHYPNTTDNGVSSGDWTHVNDVDVIAPGLYMVSLRNFDQVIVVNRSTKEIVMRLGSDGEHSILDEQHNPSYLNGSGGRPTILVADSENDRVVEYACDRTARDHPLDGDMKPNCEWNMTWEAGVNQLSWPRDADRLPNGNTLIADTINHRVLEISPNGTVVWEFSAPWLPYDAERPVHGHEPTGPTMKELNKTGTYALTNGNGLTTNATATELTDRIEAAVVDLPAGGPLAAALDRYSKVAPWVRPVWLGPDAFFLLSCAIFIGLCWGVGESVLARQRIVRGLRKRIAHQTDGAPKR